MWRAALLVAAMAWSSGAMASTGPWVLAPGELQVYAGTESQRFSRLANAEGSGSDAVVDVDQGITAFGLKGIATYGVLRGFEIELELPWATVRANRTDGPLCTALALGACRTTSGVGIVVVRTKGLLLDEFYGAPITLSLGLDARFGQTTLDTRERLTNLGEGTFDLEPRLSVGRSGGLGRPGAYWSGFADLGLRWRFPTHRDHPATGGPVPGYELTSQTEVLFAPLTALAFGPSSFLLWRPRGIDTDTLLTEAIDDVDRFAALSVTSWMLGGKVLLRANDRVTVAFGAYHTAYAVNNPTNTLYVSAGVAVRAPTRRVRGEEP